MQNLVYNLSVEQALSEPNQTFAPSENSEPVRTETNYENINIFP